jgi:hypothetical protein
MGWTVWKLNPGGEEIFAPVQTSCEAHLAFHAMGTGSILDVKQPGHGTDHPLLSSTFMASSRVNFTAQKMLIIEKIVRSVYHYGL